MIGIKQKVVQCVVKNIKIEIRNIKIKNNLGLIKLI